MELEWFFMILESVESYPHYHPHFEDFHWRTLGGREYFAHRNEVILRCGEIPTAIHLILESWPREVWMNFGEIFLIFWLIWWDLWFVWEVFVTRNYMISLGPFFLGGNILRGSVMDRALSTSHVANKIIFFIVLYTIYKISTYIHVNIYSKKKGLQSAMVTSL